MSYDYDDRYEESYVPPPYRIDGEELEVWELTDDQLELIVNEDPEDEDALGEIERRKEGTA